MKSIPSILGVAAAALALCAAPQSVFALELHAERASPTDLAIRGLLKDLPAGETRYVRWAELRALPTRTLRVGDEFVPGEQEVTVVMLADVLAKLPREERADALISICNDGYASVYTAEFMEKHQPFVVLEINGKGPETWPPEGMKFNPGPYVVSVAEQLSPGVSKIMDIGHKRPWGVDTIEFVRYEERFALWHKGALADPSPLIAEGRDIWVNSCFSCHNAPQENLGGTKAQRPIQIVATHAAYNPAYFKDYVRNPKKLNPMATMEPHPHYTDAQLDALIAFLKVTMGQ